MVQVLQQNGDVIWNYGVSGCGHRASYVSANGTWFANVMDGQWLVVPAPPVPPPPAPTPEMVVPPPPLAGPGAFRFH